MYTRLSFLVSTRCIKARPNLHSRRGLRALHVAVQISANGKTTSLGDHDTEEEAARAFDRAAINKDGSRARTNFPIDQYETEVDDLQSKITGGSKLSSRTAMRFE